jgi:hypothetical protein
MHSQYCQPPVVNNHSNQGSRLPPSNQHYAHHHHGGVQPPHGGHHTAAVSGYYTGGHQYHHPSMDGSEETPEDSSPPVEAAGRRDSFPFYPYQGHQQQQATPLQPPPHMYNGPPVSALVPRFPRGPAVMYSQGYTPNPYENQQDNRRISFPSSLPPSYPPTATTSNVGSAKSFTGSKEDRRTSFGFPIISTGSHFMIPTPQERDGDDNQRDEEDSPPAIPAPPPQEVQQQPNNIKNEMSSVLERPLLSESNENLLQESRRMNLHSKKFEPEAKVVANEKTTTTENLPTKKKPTFHDASLLLGLRTDSNTSSPATIPEMKDESEAVHTTTSTLLTKPPPPVKTTATDHIPKTCFPAKVPKNYPMRLALPNDKIKLNALHCFIRNELLEIFVVEPSKESLKFRHAPSSSVGRVGLRCVHCTMARNNSMNASREDEAPMAVFYPKSVHEIYRLVTSWQRCHVRKCKSLPPAVRAMWNDLRESEKSRGKTAYWIESARQIGMVDCPSRAGGVRFEIHGEAVARSIDDDDTSNTENHERAKAPAATSKEMAISVTSPLSQANNKVLAVSGSANSEAV